MRAGKDPRTALSHEQSLAVNPLGVFGSNAGNAMFYSAVHRALSIPGAEVVADGYRYERYRVDGREIDYINHEFDRYVLPMANSFKDKFLPHLRRLTHLIERLTIPVHVIGVGAQLPLGKGYERRSAEHKKTVRAFAAAVLERSPSIGVRGAFTAEVLHDLGFSDDQVHVTGCPSMYMYGPARLREKAPVLAADAAVAYSFTPSVKGMADFLDRATAEFPASVVIPQEHHRLALMLWGEDSPTAEDRRLPIHTRHRLYADDRMRFFVDVKTWIDYLRGYDFAVGTRLHGTIAGILAGTPSLLLVHDSRTKELAEYHGLPHRMFRDLPLNWSVRQLYAETDTSGFAAAQERGFASYLDFLARHELANVFEDGKENPMYDVSLAEAGLPGPVHTLMADGEVGRRQVMERLTWLRQGGEADRRRTAYRWAPPPVAPEQLGTADPADAPRRSLPARLPARLRERLTTLLRRVRR